jgi:hypothetical protein
MGLSIFHSFYRVKEILAGIKERDAVLETASLHGRIRKN